MLSRDNNLSRSSRDACFWKGKLIKYILIYSLLATIPSIPTLRVRFIIYFYKYYNTYIYAHYSYLFYTLLCIKLKKSYYLHNDHTTYIIKLVHGILYNI